MFEIVALDGCPHSASAIKTLQDLHDTNPNLKINVVRVNSDTKNQYKTTERPTFPQISFQYKNSKGQVHSIYLGGREQLESLVEIAHKLKSDFGPKIIAPLLQLIQC
jgi:glutaredoxin